MFKKLLFLLLLVMVGCGYQIVGLGKLPDAKFYLERIINMDKESDFFTLMDDESKMFLNTHNILASKEDYDYSLSLMLSSVNTDSSIVSKTSQTMQTNLTSSVTIVVTDKNGKKVFEKNYTSTNSYNISNNISLNIEERNNAFRKTLKGILLDFLYDFEKAKK
ncbi:MAG: hypothetical protein N3C60_09480 [Calditerrivibrio sp.]|nr:hypothetical protein [Calditerrivibrio sp.]